MRLANLEDSRRRFIYKHAYSDRGNMELYIKEHKNHLFSDRTSCCEFEANQFRLFLHSLAYVLMHTLIKIGARVRQMSTRIRVHLPSSFPLKGELRKIWLSCYGSGHT